MPLDNPNGLLPLAPNFVTDVDSYKGSHHLLYRKDLNGMVAYIESRGGRYGKTVKGNDKFKIIVRYRVGWLCNRRSCCRLETRCGNSMGPCPKFFVQVAGMADYGEHFIAPIV